ncbi:MAG: hypothetical protein ACFFCS_23160 [Candidatus Hodarchaeota archaeon]
MKFKKNIAVILVLIVSCLSLTTAIHFISVHVEVGRNMNVNLYNHVANNQYLVVNIPPTTTSHIFLIAGSTGSAYPQSLHVMLNFTSSNESHEYVSYLIAGSNVDPLSGASWFYYNENGHVVENPTHQAMEIIMEIEPSDSSFFGFAIVDDYAEGNVIVVFFSLLLPLIISVFAILFGYMPVKSRNIQFCSRLLLTTILVNSISWVIHGVFYVMVYYITFMV